MKRLLEITTIAGTQRGFLLPFAQYFRAKGWQVDAMAKDISTCPECLQTFDRVWEIEWSRNPLDPRNLLLAPQLIREAIAKEKYDIVHVHTPVAAFVSRYALNTLRKQGKCKVIYTAHGFHFHPLGNSLKNLIYINLEKLGGNWTDYLVTINREDEAAARKHHFLAPDRIRYMPGIGIDLNYYNPHMVSEVEVTQIRQELGITKETPLLLSVAEFIPRKHHRDVIYAFAKLARADVHLAFAGTGPLIEKMKQLASQLGILDQVHFLGKRHDIPALIRASTVTILVSEQEGLPRSVMESLALETPVIGSKIRGTQDLLKDCGLMIEVGDIEGLTQAIAWILDHPKESQNMGKYGRERMAAYDLQLILQLHEELYIEALK